MPRHRSVRFSLVVAFALTAALAAGRAGTASAATRAVSPSAALRKSDPLLEGGRIGELPSRESRTGEDRTLSPYLQVAGAADGTELLPLKEAAANVTVVGIIAHVRLRQVFANEGSKPIEAVYVFPASTRAAVHGMRMRIGDRTIEARIARREDARADYEAAKSAGQRASLLEQQRPNVFTTSVANLMPRERIEVELEYSELVSREEAIYELVIPTVVGPRYADQGQEQWTANPYLSQGQAEPWTFDIRIQLETGVPLKDVSSPSHRIDVAWAPNGTAQVRLAEKGGGNRDFILRYRLSGDRIDSGLLTSREGDGGFFALLVEPPEHPAQEQILPREYIFVVDVSGSMAGFPLQTTQALMTKLLSQLRRMDHFNVVVFSGGAGIFRPTSVPATAENIAAGTQFVDAQQGGGGTELLNALATAFALPPIGKDISRTVVLATDGYVAAEATAFKFVREHLDSANLFAFGIGEAVNRGLIEGLARAGSGEPWVVTSAHEAPNAAEAFRRSIEEPVLTNVTVRYKDFDVREVAPMKVPDLMARRPLILFGKFRGEPKGSVEISGRTGGRTWRRVIPVVAADSERHRPLRWLWARKWIELLEEQHHLTSAPEVKEAITALGLAYRLVTPFTSFVAIDSEAPNKTKQWVSIRQPSPLPQGVSTYAFGAGIGGIALGMSGRGGGAAAKAGGGDLLVAATESRQVVTSEPSVMGRLARGEVLEVVRRHRKEIAYCHERELMRDSTLGGKVVVKLSVGPDGTVKAAAVAQSTVQNTRLEACMLERIRRWKFPVRKDDGVALITQSWVFNPEIEL